MVVCDDPLPYSCFCVTAPYHNIFYSLHIDYTMVNFVKPNLLGTQKEFTNRFVNPIKNGQCRDSNPFDIRKMKQRAHVLYTLLQGSVQVSGTYNVCILCFPVGNIL